MRAAFYVGAGHLRDPDGRQFSATAEEGKSLAAARCEHFGLVFDKILGGGMAEKYLGKRGKKLAVRLPGEKLLNGGDPLFLLRLEAVRHSEPPLCAFRRPPGVERRCRDNRSPRSLHSMPPPGNGAGEFRAGSPAKPSQNP